LKLAITPVHSDNIQASMELLSDIGKGQMLLAGRAYDADRLHNMVLDNGEWANAPLIDNRKSPLCFSPWL